MSTVIQIDRLSKEYRLGQIGGKRLVDDVSRRWASFRGKDDPLSKVGVTKNNGRNGTSGKGNGKTLSGSNSLSGGRDQIWALKDVSFEVKQGEVLGIIGKNGAGKSTLLKILSRVTAPSSGEVRIKGRIASLLEVGTGFHPDLTGRENLFLNGAILGMRKSEIRARLDEIVAFSGVEKFIDTPVKRYSSGMTVRLAFAVAAHLEPEILIIDEVLAVGDAEFQKKCLGKMKDVAGEGRTVLFVSHNMGAVSNLCASSLLLSSGRLVFRGSTADVIQRYLKASVQNSSSIWKRPKEFPHAALETQAVKATLKGRQPTQTLELEIECVSASFHKSAFVVIDVLDETDMAIMQIIPSESPFMEQGAGIHHLKIEASLPPLIPGRYRLSVWLGSNHNAGLDQVPGCVAFDVTSFPDSNRTFPYVRSHGSVIATSRLSYGLSSFESNERSF